MSRVVHFEIHATEPRSLITFYTELLGWKFQQWGPNEYWTIETGPKEEAGINGGLLPRRGPPPVDGQPVNCFVCTVEVASLEATMAKAVALGGTLAVPKMPIPGIGWLAYVKDPNGNLLGILQSDVHAE